MLRVLREKPSELSGVFNYPSDRSRENVVKGTPKPWLTAHPGPEGDEMEGTWLQYGETLAQIHSRLD